jgi:hypothetical protein
MRIDPRRTNEWLQGTFSGSFMAPAVPTALFALGVGIASAASPTLCLLPIFALGMACVACALLGALGSALLLALDVTLATRGWVALLDGGRAFGRALVTGALAPIVAFVLPLAGPPEDPRPRPSLLVAVAAYLAIGVLARLAFRAPAVDAAAPPR